MKFKRTILLAGFVILMAAGCGKYAAEKEVSTGYIILLVKKIQPAVVTIVAYDVNRNVTNLGIAYGGLDKSSQEMEAFKQAIRVDPDFAPAHYNMGIIYLNTGDKAAALEEYKILKVLDQNMAEILFERIY